MILDLFKPQCTSVYLMNGIVFDYGILFGTSILFHGNPEGWRSHYGTLIALFTTALQELGPDLVMRPWKQVLDQKRVEATQRGSTGLISTLNAKRNGQILQSLDNRSLYSVRNLETKEDALAITADCVDAALQRLGIVNSGWT